MIVVIIVSVGVVGIVGEVVIVVGVGSDGCRRDSSDCRECGCGWYSRWCVGSGGLSRDSSDRRECWCGWDSYGHGHRQSPIGVPDTVSGFSSIEASCSL